MRHILTEYPPVHAIQIVYGIQVQELRRCLLLYGAVNSPEGWVYTEPHGILACGVNEFGGDSLRIRVVFFFVSCLISAKESRAEADCEGPFWTPDERSR